MLSFRGHWQSSFQRVTAVNRQGGGQHLSLVGGLWEVVNRLDRDVVAPRAMLAPWRLNDASLGGAHAPRVVRARSALSYSSWSLASGWETRAPLAMSCYPGGWSRCALLVLRPASRKPERWRGRADTPLRAYALTLRSGRCSKSREPLSRLPSASSCR